MRKLVCHATSEQRSTSGGSAAAPSLAEPSSLPERGQVGGLRRPLPAAELAHAACPPAPNSPAALLLLPRDPPPLLLLPRGGRRFRRRPDLKSTMT